MGFFYFFPDCFFHRILHVKIGKEIKSKNIKIIASRKRLAIFRVYSNTIIYFSLIISGHQATERKLLWKIVSVR